MNSRSRLNYLEKRFNSLIKNDIEPIMLPLRNDMFDFDSPYILDENGNIQYKAITSLKDKLKLAAIQSRMNI